MGFQLEDGKGSGKSAGVDEENRLLTKAITYSIEHEMNHSHGMAFNCVFSQSPTAAGDCIFYMVNSDDVDLVIEGITWGVANATADDSLYIKVGDTGTRNNASALTPVNCNRGSGHSAQGTFEKGADLDGGAAGLAGGTEWQRYILAGTTDRVSSHSNFVQDLILPKTRTLTLWVDGSATGTWYITLPFHYHAA